MGHWKDIWKDAGDGQYNCTYPDGLTDMGQLLELFVDTVRLSRNTSWLTDHLPAAIRIGRYLLRARRQAVPPQEHNYPDRNSELTEIYYYDFEIGSAEL
jgi:hypothetical protein